MTKRTANGRGTQVGSGVSDALATSMKVPASLSSAGLCEPPREARAGSLRLSAVVASSIAIATWSAWSSRSKGDRREDAREKKATMATCWVPAGNNPSHARPLCLRRTGRERPDRFRFEAKVARTFDVMIARASGAPPAFSA